jgi:hypothetical protein
VLSSLVPPEFLQEKWHVPELQIASRA